MSLEKKLKTTKKQSACTSEALSGSTQHLKEQNLEAPCRDDTFSGVSLGFGTVHPKDRHFLESVPVTLRFLS